MKNYFFKTFTARPYANVASLLSMLVLLLLQSCFDPGIKQIDQPVDDRSEVPRDKSTGLFALPATVALNKVEVYLDKGSATTGTVTVEIRHSVSGTTVGSVTVTASSIATGGAWKTFSFAPWLTLNRGEKYRIYLKRSDAHNYAANNYIFWRTSSGGIDAYPDGINDVHPAWTLDYAFRTHTEGGIDQQQTSTSYGFFTSNSFYRWQEFKADYPKVQLLYVYLNLQVGSATTGTFTVELRNEDGTAVIATRVVSGASLPPGTSWRVFKFGSTLYRDQKYRIYVTRSDAHNYAANNYIFWRSSSGGVDAYPDGVNDVYPAWTLDYAFRTYVQSALDQDQSLITYGFFTSNGFYRWQEFVPRNQ
ncbi:MAG: hypothetical protein ACOYXT_12140 [Bacteroidota bacterium]